MSEGDPEHCLLTNDGQPQNGNAPAGLVAASLVKRGVLLLTQRVYAAGDLDTLGLAERVNLPVDELVDLLATLDAQPPEARERFLRGFVEAWLVQQREAYDAEQHGGGDG